MAATMPPENHLIENHLHVMGLGISMKMAEIIYCIEKAPISVIAQERFEALIGMNAIDFSPPSTYL